MMINYGPIDRRMDGWTDEGINEWMDGWMDERTDNVNGERAKNFSMKSKESFKLETI